jgi:glutamate/aspartate transport system substrate-binding protein
VVSGIRNGYSLVTLDIEWVEATMINRFQLVANGTIDMECGASAITLSRMKSMDFSAMTWIDSGTFLTRRGQQIRTVADLAGKKVAVFKSATTEKALLAQALAGGQVTTQIVLVADRREAMETLQSGAVDALAGDRMILASFARKAPDPEQFGIADYRSCTSPTACRCAVTMRTSNLP